METGIFLIGSLLGNQGGDADLPGILRDSKRVFGKRSFPLYGSSVRGTWREGTFTGNS